VPVPLVLHGSSGVPDEGLAAAVTAGMTKINIATQLNKAFTAAVRGRLAADPVLVDPRRYNAAGRDAIAGEVTRLLGVLCASQGEHSVLPGGQSPRTHGPEPPGRARVAGRVAGPP